MSPPNKWLAHKSYPRNSAQSTGSTLSRFRLERWITAEFAEVEPGSLTLIDIKYINAFLEEVGRYQIATDVQRYTQMLIDIQTLYLDDGPAAVELWVDTWLVRIVNEALFWIERGCLLRRAASLLLAAFDELLELYRFSWGLGPLAVINQARRVRSVLNPEGDYPDEYLPSLLGSAETASILDPSLELDLDGGASCSGVTESSEVVDDACEDVVVQEKRWRRWKRALSM